MSSIFPTGYDPSHSYPVVKIYDFTNTLQYEYDSPTLYPSGRVDFRLRSLSFKVGMGSDFGSATLLIDDFSNGLTETTQLRRRCKIKRQWDIQIYCGKTIAGLSRWFYGKILDTEVLRPGTNRQQIRITCVGYGIRGRDRLTSIKRFQTKLTDGVSVDTTDTSTYVSNLVSELFTKTDHFIHQGLSTESELTLNQVQSVPVSLADWQEDFTTFAAAMDYLASSGGVVWGVDADRDVFFRDPFSYSSGFLFTNDLSSTNLDTQNWDQTKIGFILNQPNGYNDSSLDGGYSILHGFGGVKDTVDINNNTSNATYTSLPTKYLAIKLTPITDNISKIALYLSKTGTPANPAVIQIIGDDGSGNPKSSDIRKTISVPTTKLTSLGVSGAWIEISVSDILKITPSKVLFIVLNKYGDVSNTYNCDYQTGSGTYYESTDNSTWGAAQTGNFRVRTYNSKLVNVILENTKAVARFGVREKAIPFRNKNVSEKTVRYSLINASSILGKEKRIYQDYTVSMPSARIPLGAYCRFYDKFNSLNIKAIIKGYSVDMVAGSDTNLGASKVKLVLEDWY